MGAGYRGGPVGSKPPAMPTRLERDREKAGAWRWLASTKRLQEEAYGYDFRTMRQVPRRVCDYLTHMSLGLFNEIVEAMYEWEWKRWSSAEAWYDRERILSELVDQAHFIGNMAVALDCSDEEWEKLYRAKQAQNRERMAARYPTRRPKPSEAR